MVLYIIIVSEVVHKEDWNSTLKPFIIDGLIFCKEIEKACGYDIIL